MRHHTCTVRKDGPAFASSLCVLLLLAAGWARAEVAVYQATVPLKGTTQADRGAAFSEALRVAAVRASGRRDAEGNPVIDAAASDPSRYVQRYATTADGLLKVGFDAPAMDRLLMQAGLPLWPIERPVTLVLLVTPTVAGGSRAILDGDRVPERAAIESAAQRRGLPIVWPRQAIDAARVRAVVAGDAAAVAGMLGSGPQALLAGVASGPAVDWKFQHGGQVAQGQGSPADGIGVAADALAARYAPASTRGMTTVAVRVGSIGSLPAYAGLLEYLDSLSLVRSVAVEELAGDVVSLSLGLRGDLELLRRIAALDSRLRPPAAGAATEPAAVDFVYQP
jgi:hypothetical protein